MEIRQWHKVSRLKSTFSEIIFKIRTKKVHRKPKYTEKNMLEHTSVPGNVWEYYYED